MIYTEKISLAQALSKRRENSDASKPSIGFVPTMGALHKGHLSLIHKALSENDLVVVSIFVNPTQFNNAEDLKKYPIHTERDIALLEEISKDIFVYLPMVAEVYGNHVSSAQYLFDGLDKVMEGKHRSGHFDGVATVLDKFFKVVQPDKAYFGEKDFQQLQIVRKLVEKSGLPIQIIGCPIFREDNGLAMSSRNERLSAKEREEAAIIYETLLKVKEKFTTNTLEELSDFATEQFLQNPNLELEYFEIVNEDTLKPEPRKTANIKYRAFVAVFMGQVRLIDNMLLN